VGVTVARLVIGPGAIVQKAHHDGGLHVLPDRRGKPAERIDTLLK